MDKKKLVAILDDELKSLGFQRKSTSWYLDQDEIIQVINLQKSSYSNLFYVNISIYIKAIEPPKGLPKEEQCHIRTRLDRTMVDAPKNYDYLFDLENVTLNDKDYKREMSECVAKNIIPQLESINSKEGVLKVAEKNSVMLNMLPLSVKSHFGI
ncbi:MAG: DUF4304 domain-containing protein [Bacteroidota bacterium]